MNSMKFRFCLTLLFLTSFSTVYGQSIYPQDGVYGGIESGVAIVNVNGTFGNIRSSPESEEYIGLDYTKSVIGINVGYGMYFEENLVGLEIHHSVYTKKIDDSFIQGNFAFDLTAGSKSEIDLILARKIGTHSLLSLRFGVALTNINLIADYIPGSERYVLDKKWNGYSLGMGYVFGINEYLAVKTKYNLTTFINNKFPDSNSKLVDNRVTLSLIYSIWSPE